MRRFLLTALTVAALVPAVAAKAATSADDVRVERISVYDLNLASAEGETLAQRRIRDAARRVCADDASSLRFARAERACRRNAERLAMASIKPMIVAARQSGGQGVSAGLR